VAVAAALVNAISLLVIAAWIVWEALTRLGDPELPNSALMIGVALANVVVNVVISVKLHAGAQHDMNIRSAYLHMVVDVVSTLGVVAAGVVVAVTGSPMHFAK
jgi:cobalt-zinc-cadmium efflux system protein